MLRRQWASLQVFLHPRRLQKNVYFQEDSISSFVTYKSWV
jgi:hypothetical protein